MSNIPPAVLEMKRLAEERDAAAEAESIANQPPANQPPAEPPPQPETGVEDRSQTLDYLARGDSPANEAPPPQPSTPVEQEMVPKTDYDAALHRVSVLEGKSKVEGPRDAALIKQLRDDLKSAHEQLQTPKEPAHLTHLTEEERQEYANRDDALGIHGRAMQGEADARFSVTDQKTKVLEERLDRAEQAIHASEVDTVTSKFIDHVERIAPGARQIDTMPEYGAFLDRMDPDSANGSTLRDKAESAFHRGDHKTVAELTRLFQEEKGLVRDVPSSTTRSQLKPEVATGSDAGAPQSPSPDSTITGSQILQFTNDISRGVYSTEEAETILEKIRQAKEAGQVDNNR